MSRARTLSDIIASVPDAVRWKLDQEIDFEHRDIRGQVIPQDLGRIADIMVDWQDIVADLLGLSVPDRNDIADRNPDRPKLQRREALSKWKSGLGKAATYKALIEVFFNAGKVDYADAVCDLFKDNTGATSDLGVGSTTPTTTSHAQTASATTNTTAAHIGFSLSMGPDSLAQWLRQEYGSDYHEDVEKLCKAKINGKQLLNNVSTMISKLDLSFGFQMEIEERTKQLKDSAGATLPSSSAANLPQATHTLPPSTQTQPSAQPVLSHQSLFEQLKPHAAKWREIGTHLGFHQPQLNSIQAKPALFMEAPGSWLSAMLTDYLEWRPGDSRGSTEYATLEKLKIAVDKAGLGRTAAELR